MIDNETRENAMKWVASNSVGGKDIAKVQTAIQINEAALKIAVKLIKKFEGCELRAYPDPASPLYKELSKHNILRKYLNGQLELPPYLAKLSGAPWTAMYGETKGIVQGQVYTIEEANSRLEARVEEFMQGVIKTSPKLLNATVEKLAAVTSLCYNIGDSAYAKSTVARCIAKDDWQAAGDAFLLFNKAGGVVMQGLISRRKVEREVFLSVRG